jgi:hypothetical protein
LILALPPALALSPMSEDHGVPSASAAVSILMSLEELLDAADSVVVGTALDHRSQWEDLAGGRRIVTYTRIKVEQTVVGRPSSEVWVRTLGGVVGKVGQAVSGEAQIGLNTTSLLFLTKADTVLVVTGMAQGHFPIVESAGSRKLASSPDAGTLLPRRGPSISAQELLVGTTVDSGIESIQRARRAQNGKK